MLASSFASGHAVTGAFDDIKMMKTLFLLLLAFPICVLAESVNIMLENTILLHTDYPHKSTWSPTKEQCHQALGKVLAFIDNPSEINDWQKKEVLNIKENVLSFKVQFVGIEVDGEKRIWCNIFKGDDFDYWKDKVVLVKDGGFWFWQIEYVLESGTCVNFKSNGYA